jgi:hypothetical protein
MTDEPSLGACRHSRCRCVSRASKAKRGDRLAPFATSDAGGAGSRTLRRAGLAIRPWVQPLQTAFTNGSTMTMFTGTPLSTPTSIVPSSEKLGALPLLMNSAW